MLKTVRDLRMTEEDFIPADARGMDNMSYGSVHETWMVERLKDAGILKYGGKLWEDMQVNLRDEEGNGYMDAWAFYEGEDICIEIKTKGARDFDAITSGKKEPDKAHIYQLMIYMHLMILKKNVPVKKGWLLYMDREKHFETSNGEIVPRWDIIEVPYNQRLGEKLHARLVKLSEHKRNGTLPKKEPKSSEDDRCRYCSYKRDCWGEPAPKKTRNTATADRIAKASNARRRARPLLGNTQETE